MPAAGLLGVAARPSVTSCDNEAVWLGADEFDEPAGVASARIACVAGDDSAERRVSSQTLREWLPQRALAPFISCVWVQRVELARIPIFIGRRRMGASSWCARQGSV
jgi:hypothetical protein